MPSAAAAPAPGDGDALAARLAALRATHGRDGASVGVDEGTAAAGPSPSRNVNSRPSPRPWSDDPLAHVDDAAVDDLLLALAADGLGDEDAAHGSNSDSDGDLLPLPDVPTTAATVLDRLGAASDSEDDDGDGDGDGDRDHAQRVQDLLDRLAGTRILNDVAAGGSSGDSGGAPATGRPHGLDKDADGPDDSDDSDGDTMAREVRRVLEAARDEAALAPDKDDDENECEDKDTHETDAPAEAADNHLGLPAVPTRLVDPPPDLAATTSAASASANLDLLPSVPAGDPPAPGDAADAADTADTADAADDDGISARLAALRGLRGRAAGLGHTDAFGLPSAPTFQPGADDGVLQRGHRGHGRRLYTDADQQTWCVVCLEDAAVRCLGCAEDGSAVAHAVPVAATAAAGPNNAYCVRCWRDMHVGPAAAFDARGHKCVPLVR